MKKFILIATLLLFILGCILFSCRQKPEIREKAIAQTLILQIDSFRTQKNILLAEATRKQPDEKKLQHLFLQTRLAYKKIEWATEYFDPVTSRFVNGPPVQEIEMSNGQVFEPAGLQVIEGYLFPHYDSTHQQDLIHQLQLLQQGCDTYKAHFVNVAIFNWQVFDASKLEVFRILSLGITGFDNPLSLQSMRESAASLKSVKTALSHYEDTVGNEDLPVRFDAAGHYLLTNKSFNSFNRAFFITAYGNPLTTSIANLESKLKFHPATYNRLLNQSAKTLFDKDAFNVNAYTPDLNSFATAKRIALGRTLFSDPSLSGTGTRSCQTCHQPDKAFTDGMVVNTNIITHKSLKRNTPTLINAALQPSQFYDLRANTLEDQSNMVVHSREEMKGSMILAAKRLWQNKYYSQQFADAFPIKNRTAIDTLEIMNAIGSYVRSLVLLNSRFDEYMQGNRTAMSQQEINGFNLFMGKAKCATCHYMPLFNGSFPPRYMIIESEVIGVPKTANGRVIDDDMGRYTTLKTPAFKNAFKISTVRNAARTAPYMHNGVFATLKQVIDFYNKGGGTGLGFNVDNQTLPTDKLNLTNKETDDIIAFIGSLNSK